MSNNQVIANVTLAPGVTFTGVPTGTLLIDFIFAGAVVAAPSTLTTATFTFNLGSPITPGIHNFLLVLAGGEVIPTTPIVGTVNFTINSNPVSNGGPFTLLTNGDTGEISGGGNILIFCLHGSSLIQMREGTKRLDQIKEGDEILSGKNLDQYTKVKGIAQCWLSLLGVDHDAIIFEPNSLGLNEPNQKLIIDPGHPMCTQKEYLEKGFEALRPAGTYWEELKSDKIYSKKWTDVFVQNEPSVRYDLILEEPFNTYIANGMVVRAKGYKDHRYKEFV